MTRTNFFAVVFIILLVIALGSVITHKSSDRAQEDTIVDVVATSTYCGAMKVIAEGTVYRCVEGDYEWSVVISPNGDIVYPNGTP